MREVAIDGPSTSGYACTMGSTTTSIEESRHLDENTDCQHGEDVSEHRYAASQQQKEGEKHQKCERSGRSKSVDKLTTIWSIVAAVDMGLLSKSSLKNVKMANYSDLNFLRSENAQSSPDLQRIVVEPDIFGGSWPFIDPAQIRQVARTKRRRIKRKKRRTAKQRKKSTDSAHCEIDDETTTDHSIQRGISSSFEQKRESRVASNPPSSRLSTDNFSLAQLRARSRDCDEGEDHEYLSGSYGSPDEDEEICQVTSNASLKEIVQADNIDLISTDCGYSRSYSLSQKEELQNRAELSEYPEYFMNVLHTYNNTENNDMISEGITSSCDTSLEEVRHTELKKYATRSRNKINSRRMSVNSRSASNPKKKEPLKKKRNLRSNLSRLKTMQKKERIVERKKHRNIKRNIKISKDLESNIKRKNDDVFTVKTCDSNSVQVHRSCNTRQQIQDSRSDTCMYKKNLKDTAEAILQDIKAIPDAEITKNVENVSEAISEIFVVKPNEKPEGVSSDISTYDWKYDWAISDESDNENVLSQVLYSKQSFDSVNVDLNKSSAHCNKRYKSSIDCKFVDKKETTYHSIFHDCVDLNSLITALPLKINMEESWKSEDRDSGVEMIHSSWRRSTLTEEYNNEFDSALLLARKIVSDDSAKDEKCYHDDHEAFRSTCYKYSETTDMLPAMEKSNSIQTDRNDTYSDAEDTDFLQSAIDKDIITYRRIKIKKKILEKASTELVNSNPVKDMNKVIKVQARVTRSTKLTTKVVNEDLTRRPLDEKVNDLEYDKDDKYSPRRVTRALVKTSQENHAGKLVWGLCSGWWPALIVDAEHVGMAAEPGKLWVYWMGESQISLLKNEKTQIQPFSAKLEHRLAHMTSRKNIRTRAVSATIQMLHQRFTSTLTKPYYNWIQRNIARVRRLDDLTFYPYPDNVQEKLNELKEKNIRTTEKYKLNQNSSPETSPTKKQSTDRIRQNTEKNKETNTSWRQIDDERLPLQNQYPGVIAWAKIAGHSWWPAMIIDYRDCCLKEPIFGCQWIMWYGDYQVSEVRHLEFLKFHKGLQKMRNHIQTTVKQSYIEGVLQASKDYCSRLGCNTDDWTLDNVFEYFSNMDNIDVAHNQLQVSKSNKIYDKYSDVIAKKINKFMSKPTIDAERKSEIKASDALHKVKTGECGVEKLCLKCLKFPKGEVEAHPFFIGSLCRECSNAFKPCMFVHGNDGKCFYCTVCAVTGTVLICDVEDCPRVYCTACSKFLLYPKSYDNMLEEDPWECILCRDESRQPVDAIVRPRFDWKEKFTKMFRTVSNYIPDDLELVSYKKEKKPIRVLSLFDGLSTGFLVLSNLGIAVEAYYASEIDINSLTVSSTHFGDRITNLGDVRDITEKMIKEIAPIDLLIGGSPCNDLSLVNPARLGLHNSKGTGILFFDYCRIRKLLEKVNNGRHLFWLFENVASMPTEYRLEINKHLGQEPDVIDAADFSPQHRLRLYWHNFPFNPYMPLYQSHQDVQDKLTPNLNRKALCKKLRTVTCRTGSLLQGKAESKPIMMKGASDTLWITELEEIFGFPRHYTDVKNLSATNRQKLLGKSWSVQTLTAILRPLCFYFKCNEDEISKSILHGNTSIAK